jgi:adenosylcobyric acid synthase
MHFEGYEIHMGRTKCDEGSAFRILERSGQACEVPDGCLDASGRVLGTYIHGLFHNRELRRAILRHIARSKDRLLDFASVDQRRDHGYDTLAELARQSLRMSLIYTIIGLKEK